ncbi:leucyl/phenylalanyl-tRNA--protein transferase [Methyloprofundus sedimenti]|uniref:Leucyl/phenylalanyl-tRNA--protein transferase n=1 Tax=Methyloprofundus sedimenti TaxID=1420851 RepID=A0A1V8MB40_9GAMM|nr:leucyl/phenylalanyl-tRNA--protein transferase [Methyloprofundus sedimenti]OQK18722.1 leucyl/phenylalanyl-tRNA--protein transferase [Methyloprofundus sedimenti]
MMLTLLDPNFANQDFPSTHLALRDPDGLLAVGGCLSTQRIINAYSQGIFPWYSNEDPILWWSPDPRLVIFPKQLHISRSLQKTLRKQDFKISFDTAFTEVIKACAAPRSQESGTWLTAEMQVAYIRLHDEGYAHSVEAWHDNKLVGGLYGIAIGQVFFGESMFHSKTDASKVAFVSLIQQLSLWDFQLIDCQVHTQHLVSMGAEEIRRTRFCSLLQLYKQRKPAVHAWQT